MDSWDADTFTWCKSSYSSANANCVEVGTWHKNSYSSDNANCVEVARDGPVVGVRDSKDPDGGFLLVPADRWRHFVRAI